MRTNDGLLPISRGRRAYIARSVLAQPVTPGPIPINEIPREEVKDKGMCWLASAEPTNHPEYLTVLEARPLLYERPERYVAQHTTAERRRSRRALRRASRLAYRYPSLKLRGYTLSIVLVSVGFTVMIVATVTGFLLQTGYLAWRP